MPRQPKLGRPKKHPGKKPGATKWTPTELAKLKLHGLDTALQARDGSWAMSGTVVAKFADQETSINVLIKRISVSEAQWAQKGPQKINATELADWIKAYSQFCGEYPSASQLRQILTTYRVNLVALNNAYWSAILAAGEPTSKPLWKKPKVTPVINRVQLDEADRIFELSKRRPVRTGIFRHGSKWYVRINLRRDATGPWRIHGAFASREDALAKLNYWKQLLENGEK
jgi:hypothetical protein